MEHFTVKHYIGDSRPTLKGNGFDGLEVGRTREDAQDFVTFLNAAIDAANRRSTGMSRAFEAPYGAEPQMGGNDAAIREAAVRASAEIPKQPDPDQGDKTRESCKARAAAYEWEWSAPVGWVRCDEDKVEGLKSEGYEVRRVWLEPQGIDDPFRAAVRASAQMPKDDEPGSLVFAARHALSDLKWARAAVPGMNFQSSILLLEAALKGRV